MFVNAIEQVARFTRAIHTISRNYNENLISPGAATIFFVNEEGCAITCKHVIDLISGREAINRNYEKFRAEKAAIGRNNKFNQRLKSLETSFNYNTGSLIQLKELFVGVTGEPELNYSWINHPQYDLSIIKFNGLKSPLYQSYAIFKKDGSSLKQGKFLCRLGFPFPEFTNFSYDQELDDIIWTKTGQVETPRFPIEGMLTRHVLHEGKIAGLELSTPGLRGQSGGPLFDEKGIVCGMQSSTHHLHLGFDMNNFDLLSNGRKIKINNQPFLHVGHCVHADVIKSFLREQNIKYYEETE